MSNNPHLPPYIYCPVCGGALDTPHPHRQLCQQCDFIFYHSSSPCMGAIPVEGNRVLLARRGIEPYFGTWNTVGGFLDYGEEPLEGLMREVLEETGCRCRVLDSIIQTADFYGEGGAALLNSYYTVELLDTNLKPQDDVSELCWFELDCLPADIKIIVATRCTRTWQRILQI